MGPIKALWQDQSTNVDHTIVRSLPFVRNLVEMSAGHHHSLEECNESRARGQSHPSAGFCLIFGIHPNRNGPRFPATVINFFLSVLFVKLFCAIFHREVLARRYPFCMPNIIQHVCMNKNISLDCMMQ